MKLKKYLNQPFPNSENKWKTIILVSLFVALFLIVFQPFGINLIEKTTAKIFFLSGYGIVTFVVLIIDLIIIESLFPIFFRERNWVIWKEFIWLLWVIFSIGLGNAIYTAITFEHSKPSIELIIVFQFLTLAVAVIPVTILIISKQKYLSRKYSVSANDVNKKLEKEKSGSSINQQIKIYGDNLKDFIEVEISDFLFIESSGNYIEIHYIENDKEIRKTLRNTIKSSLSFFNNIHEVMQCHRAFIVNSSKIINVKGNSQGLRLALEKCDIEVPVSRGYVEKIKQKIN